ncbi:MAG: flavodoxin [Chitinivibrionales bacterium]
MKAVVLYGSTTNNTRSAADTIGKILGIDEIKSVDRMSADEIASFDVIIAGTSTWGYGEIQDDWAPLVDKISRLELKGKKVALFGTGDQTSYSDTFVDGIGILYDAFTAAGAAVIGTWPTDGYEYSSSRAVKGGEFVGLALDDDNQAGMTDERIKTWVELIKPELG